MFSPEFGTATRMSANALMGAVGGAYMEAGKGWENAIDDIARTLVRPDLAGLQVADMNNMDAFGHMSPQLTPGMNTVYGRSLDNRGSPFGMAA